MFELARQRQSGLELAASLIKSKLLPRGIDSPEAAFLIMAKGHELGIAPLTALSHIAIINGKPTQSAELMLALALKAGLDVWVAETTAERATVKGIRNGREQSLSFTAEDAKRAGLNTDPWRKYPAAMLRARAISAFMRFFAPDILSGASYTAEELGAQVDEDGEIVDADVRPATPAQNSTQTPTQPGNENLKLSAAAATRLRKKIDSLKLGLDSEVDVIESALGPNPADTFDELTQGQATKVYEYATSLAAKIEAKAPWESWEKDADALEYATKAGKQHGIFADGNDLMAHFNAAKDACQQANGNLDHLYKDWQTWVDEAVATRQRAA